MSMFSSVSSWLGVGTRPKDDQDEDKENKKTIPSEESKDSISSTSVETSITSSKSELTETESDAEVPITTSEESSQDNSPLDTLEDVSAKALSTAKEFGNILFSFGKAASKTIADTAKELKQTVEEKTILGDFSKEQNKFVDEKKEKEKEQDAAVPPWVGYNEEDTLRTQIMALSQDKRNFVRNPPAGVQFQFDFNNSYPVAQATLLEDENLKKMRFDLVPKMVKEEVFWRNYFYRVSLIRQSSQLTSSLAQQSGKSSSSSSRRSSTGSSDNKEASKKAAEDEGMAEVTVGGQDEFVSDAFEDSGMTEEDIRKEMEQQLKDQSQTGDKTADDETWKKELEEKLLEQQGEEWEKELQQELQDYELVDGEIDVGDDEELEREILQQIEQEAGKLT